MYTPTNLFLRVFSFFYSNSFNTSWHLFLQNKSPAEAAVRICREVLCQLKLKNGTKARIFSMGFFRIFQNMYSKIFGRPHICTIETITAVSRLTSEVVTHCGVLLLVKIKVKYTTTYVFQGPLLSFSEHLFNREFFLF